ncbi:MAG: calcium:proton antiporter [Planctomycetota bacterium]|nr:calcium:proton antiporter [Planctomycetota bacterium]
MINFVRREYALIASVITLAIFLTMGDTLLAVPFTPGRGGILFAWLFLIILMSSFSVVRHAEWLAHKFGEPYGTLILTLAVISIEVAMIASVMLTGADNPTLARDTMFAVLMLVLNGLIGACLLIGGIFHREQYFNLRSASSYISLILVLAVLGMILPTWTTSTRDASHSTLLAVFLTVTAFGIYGVFLGLQASTHRDYFVHEEPEEDQHTGTLEGSWIYHASLLLLTMVPVVLLAKKIAVLLQYGLDESGLPASLGGVAVAVLVLSPEGLAAIGAARANKIQRVMNISLGSGLATIGLTIPAVLAIGLITGEPVQLGLDVVDTILLCLTLGLCVINFLGGRTNMLQGFIHLLVFGAWIVLIFD